MKRSTIAQSLIAVGLAAAAVGAQAQTNVTVYGRVNTTLERTKIEKQPGKQEVVNNNSRIGFTGSEDLGGGMAGIFQIESGFLSDTGGVSGVNGTLASRDSWVGLKSNAGTVKLGNITDPLYYATHDYISLHNHDTGNSADAFLWVPAYDPLRFRLRNAVTYASPSFGGFMIQGAYSLLGERRADLVSNVDKEQHWSVTGTYDVGALHVGLGYAQTKTDFLGAPPDAKDNAITAAALYDFKVVVLGALWEHNKSEDGGFTQQTGLAGSHKRNHYRVAVMVPFGPNEIHLNAAKANDWSGTSDTGAKQYTVAYNYNLSKRTKVYALWTKIDNDKQVASIANGDAYNGGGGYSFLSGTGLGLDNTSFGAGIRHNF